MTHQEQQNSSELVAGGTRRDAVIIATLVATLAILLPLWPVDENVAVAGISGNSLATYLPMAIDMILPALGFLLALRCGKIDLSVWTVAGVGGLITASLIVGGMLPVPACCLAVLVGGAIGAINGVMSTKLRVPSFIATLVMAIAIVLLCSWLAQHRYVNVTEEIFDSWRLSAVGRDMESSGGDVTFLRPLSATRMLLSVGVYAIVIFLVIVRGEHIRNHPGRPSWPRLKPALAMIASGALSAGGGVLWLIDHGQAFAPTHVMGDLRLPAAAILAGGALLVGRERTMLTIILLPAAMLVCTIWEVSVAAPAWHLWDGQLWLLIGQAGVLQLCGWIYSRCPSGQDRASLLASVAAFAGLLVLAATAWVTPYSNPLRIAMQFAGPAISIIALVLAIRTCCYCGLHRFHLWRQNSVTQ